MGDDEWGEEALARSIFEDSVLGIVVVDRDGRLRRTNPAFQRFLGYSAEELQARAFAETLHPDDVDTGRRLAGELFDGARDSYQVERRYVRKDGGTVWGRLSVSARRGEPTLLIAMVEDTTAAHAGEASRLTLDHTLGERVKELTALHHAARLMLDAARPREERLLAIAALMPPAMEFPDLCTGCVRYRGHTFATPGHGETAWMLRAPFETADGSRGEIEVAYREAGPFVVEEAALLGSLAGIVRSALDRDHAIEELREVNVHLNLALSAAGMAVWEWDVESGSTRWSEQLAEMTGFLGPLVGPLSARLEFVHPDDTEMLRARMLAVGTGHGDLTPWETRLRRPDGGWRRVLVCSRGYQSPEGTRRVVAALVDVSVRHALEEGLRQAQKLEALGQVAGGVAHDFNNLLAVILAGVEFLRAELTDPALLEVIEDLQAAAGNGISLTRQLLAFSRKSEFQPTAVDVTGLVTRLHSVLARLVGRRIKLHVEADRPVGRVWADPTQLEQVVMNLVVNARDAMPDGGTITMATDVVEGDEPAARGIRPGRYACISVRDSGPGIPPELVSRIFEPFFTTKEPGKGTGLGLALVAGVARQWQGHILVDTEPGRGANFRVLFPQLPRP